MFPTARERKVLDRTRSHGARQRKIIILASIRFEIEPINPTRENRKSRECRSFDRSKLQIFYLFLLFTLAIIREFLFHNSERSCSTVSNSLRDRYK